MQRTHRQNIILAALASRPGSIYAPVQVQKLFFLIDENIPNEIGGKLFAFEPYDYGPFDKAVYRELEQLSALELVKIFQGSSPSSRRYGLTPAGQSAGEESLAHLSPRARDFIRRLTDWVCKLSFAQLVGSIYKAYPTMREKSIFVEK